MAIVTPGIGIFHPDCWSRQQDKEVPEMRNTYYTIHFLEKGAWWGGCGLLFATKELARRVALSGYLHDPGILPKEGLNFRIEAVPTKVFHTIEEFKADLRAQDCVQFEQMDKRNMDRIREEVLKRLSPLEREALQLPEALLAMPKVAVAPIECNKCREIIGTGHTVMDTGLERLHPTCYSELRKKD